MAYRRVLLKMSGEALSHEGAFGIDSQIVRDMAEQVKAGMEGGDLQLALVVGGGNYIRGQQVAAQGMDRTTGDNMGMLATIMNSLALQAALEGAGVETRVMSAIGVNGVAEPFIRRRCIRHLEKGRVVILAGGTGHPYFTTDTTAALRALELDATLLLKATKVRGVYSADPKCDPKAQFLERLSFQEVLVKRLRVMDWAAISLCMENKLPIVVFNMTESGNIVRALHGERLGTLVE
jgi:uridylate kinase